MKYIMIINSLEFLTIGYLQRLMFCTEYEANELLYVYGLHYNVYNNGQCDIYNVNNELVLQIDNNFGIKIC